VLGDAQKAVEALENSFVFVDSWTCVSSPITVSQII